MRAEGVVWRRGPVRPIVLCGLNKAIIVFCQSSFKIICGSYVSKGFCFVSQNIDEPHLNLIKFLVCLPNVAIELACGLKA